MVSIVEANTDELIAKAKALFKAYAASLDFDLCFQNFDQEMKEFPRQYSPPAGCLFLAVENNTAFGCIGLRRFDDQTCEMKRLYIKPEFRGTGAGRLLVDIVIKSAKLLNYKAMRLDTLPSMKRATNLYISLGFRRIEPYRHNPIKGTVYMELDLK